MKKRYEALIWIGIVLILIGLGVAYGQNTTNSTNGDCWYINATTTLENLRNCFRD